MMKMINYFLLSLQLPLLTNSTIYSKQLLIMLQVAIKDGI